MGRFRHGAFACLLALAAASVPAQADDGADDGAERGTLSLIFENDLFYNTDRDYTNGVRAAWLSGPDDVPPRVLEAARLLPLFPPGGRIRVGYALGQNMYTPTDIATPTPSPDDRPYAGWLYGSVGLIAENGRQLDHLGLSLGVVGPASLAKETQRFVHKQMGAQDPKGWHAQLANEPGLILTYQRSLRGFVRESLSGFTLDATPHVGGSLGNVFTYANTGVMARFGRNMPDDYGPPRIQPSLPGSGFFIPEEDFGWYLFAGVEGRAVARNIFLDGNTFRGGPRVAKRPLVGDLQWGVALTWRQVRLSYTHVVRTREFDTQTGGDEFGAVTLSIRF